MFGVLSIRKKVYFSAYILHIYLQKSEEIFGFLRPVSLVSLKVLKLVYSFGVFSSNKNSFNEIKNSRYFLYFFLGKMAKNYTFSIFFGYKKV